MRNGFLHAGRRDGGVALFLPLGHDDDERGFGALPAFLQGFDDHVHTHLGFGNHHDFGPAPDGARNGDVARVAAHYLHKKAAVVRVGRVPNFVDAVQRRVHGRVVANRVIGTVQVVVYGAGRAHRGDAKLLLKNHGPGECAVAANGHQALNAVVHQLVESLLPAFLGHEFLAAGRFQNRAALLHRVRNRSRIEPHKFALNHAAVAPHDAVHLNAVVSGGTHHRADGRIHARRIAATGKNCYSLHLTNRKATGTKWHPNLAKLAK